MLLRGPYWKLLDSDKWEGLLALWHIYCFSKYIASLFTHFCIRWNHCEKQRVQSSLGTSSMASWKAFTATSGLVNHKPLSLSLIFENKKKSHGASSGLCVGRRRTSSRRQATNCTRGSISAPSSSSRTRRRGRPCELRATSRQGRGGKGGSGATTSRAGRGGLARATRSRRGGGKDRAKLW